MRVAWRMVDTLYMDLDAAFLNQVRVKSATIVGYRSFWLESGQGPAVILLSSIVASSRTYWPTLRALSRDFRVLVLDLPGCGLSSSLLRPWSFQRYAHWLREFFARLAIRPEVLIGHSNSGAVGIAFASMFPHAIGKLVLADTIGAEPKQSFFAAAMGRALDSGFVEPWFAMLGRPDVLFNSFFQPLTFLQQIGLAGRTDLSALAAKIQVPTLIAWGQRDHTMPVSAAVRLRRLIPLSRVYVSERGSHGWIVERPEEFRDAVDRFYRTRAWPLLGHA